MPVTAPPAVPVLPTPPTTVDPDNFDARSDAFLGILPNFGVAIDQVGQNVYANAQIAESSATAASASSISAANAMNQAASSASASGTSAAASAGSATAAASAAGAASTYASNAATAANAADAARVAAEAAQHAALGGAEPALAAGSADQYYRGDKTWQSLEGAVADVNATLADDAESNALPAAGSATLLVRLQAIRNYLKYLLNNKAPVSATLTNTAGSSTLPAITDTPLVSLLQTTRNCLNWLVAKFNTGGEVDIKWDIPTGSTNAIALADRGKAVTITANTSIPTNASVAFPVGSAVMLVGGATGYIITGPAATSLTVEGDTTLRTRFTMKANRSVVIRKTATNAWRVYGDVTV